MRKNAAMMFHARSIGQRSCVWRGGALLATIVLVALIALAMIAMTGGTDK